MRTDDAYSLPAQPGDDLEGRGAEAFRAFFELAPQAQLWTDDTARILRANRLAASLLAESPSRLVGRPLLDFVPPAGRRRFRLRLARLRGPGRSVREQWEMALRPAHGEAFEASVAAALMPDTPPVAGTLLWSFGDVTSRKRTEARSKHLGRRQRSLYRKLLVQRERLRSLSGRYLEAREQEAKRIAHQLRDEAAQMSAFVHLAIEHASRELPGPARERLLSVREQVGALEDRLRRISHELRPTLLDELGLGAAIGFRAESFTARTRVPVVLGGELGDEPLDPLLEVTVYRIIEEALANVARHARARRVWIRLQRRGGWLRCSIRDDGAGFDAAAPAAGSGAGLGLLGIRERLEALGGRFDIRTRPGQGTELIVGIPFDRR